MLDVLGIVVIVVMVRLVMTVELANCYRRRDMINQVQVACR